MSYATIQRDWLKKQIEKGLVEAKCELHLTDDYQFDDANGFGKTEWLPAHIMHPTMRTVTLDNGVEREIVVADNRLEGHLNLYAYYFDRNGGSAHRNADGTIHLRIHSNLYYSLRIVPAPAV